MRRLLYISYFVPPRAAIGSRRCGQLITYLPSYGWEVVVLTAQFPPGVAVPSQYVLTPMIDVKDRLKRLAGIRGQSTHAVLGAEIPSATDRHSFVQRVLNVAGTLATYPDPQIGWLPYGRAAAKAILREQRFDAVLSSSYPVTAHFISAAAIGQTPWIADLRDLWSDNPYHVRSRTRLTAERFFEQRTLKRARALVTVSEPLAETLRARYPSKTVHVIRNSFDESEWADIPFGRETKCTLLYPGTLHGGLQDPRPLFAALANLREAGKISNATFQVLVHSPERDWIRRCVEEYELSDVVVLNGLVERSAVLYAQRRADALVLFLRDDPSETGMYTGKLFEYLGARRPILAVGGPETSVVDQVLAETGAGWRYRTVEALQRRISDIVEAHDEGRSIDVPASRNSQYESSMMAQRFAVALDRLF